MALGAFLTARTIQHEAQPPPQPSEVGPASPNLVLIAILAVLALLVLRGIQVAVMRAVDRAAPRRGAP